MKRIKLLTILLLVNSALMAQSHLSADELKYSSSENIEVLQLNSDERCSSFGIKVRDSVKAHYHAWHTESLHVLKGEAQMKLGDSLIQLKAGDFVVIPPKTVHAVKVSSKEALEVISIQAPEFKGNDRHFIVE